MMAGLAPLRAMGVGRDADDERTLFVIFNRAPSDDEVDGVQDLLRTLPDDEEDDLGDRPFAPLEAYADVGAAYGDLAAAKDYAAECAMKCAEPAFKAFLHERHGLEKPLTDERVKVKVRSLLGVTSRAELNDGGKAAHAWKALRTEFDDWRRAGR